MICTALENDVVGDMECLHSGCFELFSAKCFKLCFNHLISSGQSGFLGESRCSSIQWAFNIFHQNLFILVLLLCHYSLSLLEGSGEERECRTAAQRLFENTIQHRYFAQRHVFRFNCRKRAGLVRMKAVHLAASLSAFVPADLSLCLRLTGTLE